MNKIQTKLCYIFDFFIDICQKHKLKWFCDGGTLLGAIRHKGFIPWDDDVDICMPREDYNKLSYLMHNKYKCKINDIFWQDPISDPQYFNIHARMRLDNTTAISPREFFIKSHKGMFIDIYPIDFLPTDNDVLHDLIGFMRTFCKHTDVENDDYYNVKFERSSVYVNMQYMLSYLSNKYSNKATKAGCLVFSRYSKYNDVAVSKNAYSNYELRSFDGLKHKVRVPIGYDEILTLWYGKDWRMPMKKESFHSCYINPDIDYHNYTPDKYDLIKTAKGLEMHLINE